jgi:hypothetical protein
LKSKKTNPALVRRETKKIMEEENKCEEEVCDHCKGEGKVWIGEHDDIKEVPCPYCNDKIDEDDDS